MDLSNHRARAMRKAGRASRRGKPNSGYSRDSWAASVREKEY
jgi:hypothetical protein